MEPFYSKDGRRINPEDHIASFNGKRNVSKGKALLILQHFDGEYLTANEIHHATGVRLSYLHQRLSFWYNIRYINRKLTDRGGHPCYEYKLADRGRRFVDIRMPAETRDKYIEEINNWLKINSLRY